mmetsp:Transcript_24315/g.75985  ORF Transcript_24315/g.75985 Transcript_24315/m.75985 type:complete len:336 (+) Transcript_24315:35-1042(+)
MAQVITGDETGLLKVVDPVAGTTRLVSTSFSQNRRRGVAALSAAGDGGAMARRFECARADGSLETWEEAGEGFEDDLWELGARRSGLAGACVGLSSSREAIVTCGDDGRVQVTSPGSGAVGDKATMDVEGSVSAFDRSNELVAVGGREHELSIWNLESAERQWRARNVPNDSLDMRRPVWVSAARFVTETTLAVGTMYKQLRLYDARARRRPVAALDDATEHGVRDLITLSHDKVLLGDIAGAVLTFDLKNLKLLARHVGPAGAVRGLAKHPTVDTSFAAVGLDRHCHVWDATSRERTPVASIYCKQRLNALLWLPDAPPPPDPAGLDDPRDPDL